MLGSNVVTSNSLLDSSSTPLLDCGPSIRMALEIFGLTLDSVARRIGEILELVCINNQIKIKSIYIYYCKPLQAFQIRHHSKG